MCLRIFCTDVRVLACASEQLDLGVRYRLSAVLPAQVAPADGVTQRSRRKRRKYLAAARSRATCRTDPPCPAARAARRSARVAPQ